MPTERMTIFFPAPAYILARAAWIPTLVIWHADGRFKRVESAPCGDYATALAASWRLRPHVSRAVSRQ
jgi:hypothetical protein